MVGLKRCIVALSVIYLVLHTDAADNFCGTALDKQLCEKMVKGATDWNQAMTMAITEAMNQLAKAKKSGNPACIDAYKNSEDNLKESMEIVRSGNKGGSLNSKLSAALTDLEDCKNDAEDLKTDASLVKTLNHDADQAIRVCLAVDTSKSVH